MLFAHLKRILRLDRLRLRGPTGAKDEFLFAATAQNLRKLAKLIPLAAPIFATQGEGAQLARPDRRFNRYSPPSAEGVLQHNLLSSGRSQTARRKWVTIRSCNARRLLPEIIVEAPARRRFA
jgi:hypothetical protein